MLLDVISFEKVWDTIHPNSSSSRYIASFVRFMERRLGARFLYNTSSIPFRDLSLQHILAIAEKLKKIGILTSLTQVYSPTDMPRLFGWRTAFGDGDEERAAGYSAQSDQDALVRGVAELLERYLWVHEQGLFKAGQILSEAEISKKGPYLSLSKLAGLSKEQKMKASAHASTDRFLWIQAISLITDTPMWVPAQIIGASPIIRTRIRNHEEPYLRNAITTGMATHVTQKQARLSGILENIERDAYVLLWLNQLSCARIEIPTIPTISPTLKKLLSDCDRYGLNVHAIEMPTDAPTHAIMVVVEDRFSKKARFSIGMKAGANISDTIEGALVEAVRAQCGTLMILRNNPDFVETKSAVGHRNRPIYYATGNRHEKLSFLIKGPLQKYVSRDWDTDSTDAHFERLLSWCRASSYECVSFSFTGSEKNVTPWYVEMTVIPELQPLYFTEKTPQVSGGRIISVPEKLGYTPRTKPFIDEPHPFA